MKKTMTVFVLLMFLSSLSFAGKIWQTKYKKAVKQAKKEGKALFLNFTGSDW